MKALKSLGVALALAVSTLGFSSTVQAQPSQATDLYHWVGGNEEIVVFVADDFEEVDTDVYAAWTYFQFASPVTSSAIDAVWTLQVFNCTDGTVEPFFVEYYDVDGELIASGVSPEGPATYEEGTPLENALHVACGFDSEAVELTHEQVETYVAAFVN